MRRQCDSCARSYVAKRANSRFCSEACRKRESRRRPEPKVGKPAAAAGTVVGATRARVLAALEAAGREETWQGAIALALADRVDQSTAVMGYAALTKQLGEQMDRALAGATTAADPLDELRKRRDAKRAAG